MKLLLYPSILDVMYGRVIAEWQRRDPGLEAVAIVSGRQSQANLVQGGGLFEHVYRLWEDVAPSQTHRSVDLRWLREYERHSRGPNLERLMAMDRFLARTRPPLRKLMLELNIRFLERVWEAQRPDVVIAEGVSDLPSYLLCASAARRRVPFLFLVTRGVDGRSAVVDNDRDEWTGVERGLKEIRARGITADERSRAIAYVTAFRQRPEKPNYMRSLPSPGVRASDVGGLVRLVRAYFRDRRDPNYVSPLPAVMRRVTRIVRSRVAAGAFEHSAMDERFVLFPLQLQPEMTTSVLAPFHVNQIATVEYLAKSLPVDHVLWVKEHPYSVGRRPLSYYDEVRRLGNVRLISPWADTFALIRSAAAVATISSTLGWEAMLLGTPVVTLGNVFINSSQLVRHVPDYRDLRSALAAACDEAHHAADDPALVEFVAAMLDGTYAGEAGGAPADFPESLQSANVSLLVEAFVCELDKRGVMTKA